MQILNKPMTVSGQFKKKSECLDWARCAFFMSTCECSVFMLQFFSFHAMFVLLWKMFTCFLGRYFVNAVHCAFKYGYQTGPVTTEWWQASDLRCPTELSQRMCPSIPQGDQPLTDPRCSPGLFLLISDSPITCCHRRRPRSPWTKWTLRRRSQRVGLLARGREGDGVVDPVLGRTAGNEKSWFLNKQKNQTNFSSD